MFTFCNDNIKRQLICMIFLILDNKNIELVAENIKYNSLDMYYHLD